MNETTVVDLASLPEGERFAGALVRLERKARICGKKLAFVDVRQAAPIRYNCCTAASDDETLVRKLKSQARIVRGTTFLLISGTLRADHKIDLADVEIYDDLKAKKETQQPVSRLYHRPGGENPGRQQVLQEPSTTGQLLLRIILDQYVPAQDLETGVIPVSDLWTSVGSSVLQSSCQKLDLVDLEIAFYHIFQSARHLYNQCTGAPFPSQDKFSNFMLAGVHLCELSLRRGNMDIIQDVYVRRDVVQALRLEEHQQRRPAPVASRVYPDTTWQFLRAACIQLSKLDMEEHQDHIHRTGYALHNAPRHVALIVQAQFSRLEDDNLLCQELRVAGSNLYGLDWLWKIIPDEVL